MTDPQSPDPSAPGGQSAYPPPAYGQTPPAQQPAYAAAPPPAYGAPAPGAPVPGKTLGIVAFILSFFLQLVALILGIVALVQSKKAGHKNGFAVAAIIISAVLMVIGIIIAIIVFAVLGTAAAELVRQCAELGPGQHVVNGITITCG